MKTKERLYEWLNAGTFERENGCRHPQDLIAAALDCSERTVIRCVQELEREGRLKVDRPRRRGACNTYYVADWAPGKRADVLSVIRRVQPAVFRRRWAKCHPKGTTGKGIRRTGSMNRNDSTERNTTVAHTTNCERCGTLEGLLTQAEAHIVELGQHRAGLELQLRRAGAAELALRRELEQHAEADPKSQEIRQLLDYWQRKCNHSKARTPLTGERAKLIRKAMRLGYTAEQLRQAFDGLAKFPYVGAGGRKAHGKHSERFDEVSHALKDEEKIERFIRYATEPPPARKQRSEPAVPRLLASLQNVKPAGAAQWTAKCPAHDDRHASLSVAQGRKGAVATCHAGCTHEQIVEAVGIPTAEWFDADADVAPIPIAVRPAVPLPTETQTHMWHQRLIVSDSLLTRLEELKRWDRATIARLGLGWDGSRVVFPVRDERGELISAAFYLPGGKPKMLGLHGHPRGLFPAPETIVGPELWIVEGEPDAVTSQALGLPAIGLPGVNGWHAEWAPRFDDRQVVVCFDCDKPGRDAAERVMAGLNGRAAQVRIVDLDPSRDDGYDITDAALEGVTSPVLRALASQAIPDRTLRLVV